MQRTLDRYIFRQLLAPIVGAVAALTAIALLSQSLSQLDLVVEHGQSAWTFLRVTILSMPMLAGLILPLAIFAGSLVALTRLQGEHEFTACFAAGVPLMRLSAPVVRIGVYFALISLVSSLFLQPLASRAMRSELFSVKNDLISTLVRESDFSTSSTGLTIYVQSIDQNGLLRQVFIRTPSDNGEDHTFAAKEGRITKVDGNTIIVLRNGSEQWMDDAGTKINSWDEYSVDITPYFASDDYLQLKEGDMYIHELLSPSTAWGTSGPSPVRMLSEVNARLSTPLFNIAFALLAVVSVLGGGYSRNGYAGRIAAAAGLAAVVRLLGVVAETASNTMAAMNVLQYVVPIIPIVICLYLLNKSDKVLGLAPGLTFRRQAGRRAAPLRPV